MATITTIQASDLITNTRSDINSNFANLNSDKIETSVIDTDTALAANSDAKIPSQKAVKTYVDTGGNVNASTTAKGIVEEATAAEITAGTAAGGTGARLFVNPSNVAETGAEKIVKIKSTGLLDASIIPPQAVTFGVATRAGSTASGSQTIAHGLGTTPGYVRFTCIVEDTSTTQKTLFSYGSSNGSTQRSVSGLASVSANAYTENDTSDCIRMVNNVGDQQKASAALDATNITLTWVKVNSGITGTINILWEAWK